ncbi:DUF3500 domain-containing protein [Glaciibacter sp. 2TAF33]|uniref:DUF3500 domain-containing protein n=1 Tax=Glaciibacter sp. 2TAF33 TaxID=3233015 RepID=UPI003F92A1F5
MSVQEFRQYLFPADDERINSVKGLDAYQYREAATKDPFTGGLIDGWKKLHPQPFSGVTSDGTRIPGLFALGDARPGEEAPTAAMVDAADTLLANLTPEQAERIRYAIDAVEWQSWANPEFMQYDTGLRLEALDQETRDRIFSVIEASLSDDGFTLIRDLMRINGFLGDVIGLSGIMNEFSYNFAIYGEPSEVSPWGWQIFGHHAAINCVVVGTQLVMTPVFFGAEPNCIDEGPFVGTTAFDDRIEHGRQLMNSLSRPMQERALIYAEMVDPDMPEGRFHPGDERHLAGAFQDNRVIPYEGVRVSELGPESRPLVDAIVADFTGYLPSGPAAARRREISDHYDDTWFSWIGGWGPGDVFYYRLQSPVVVLELDHHTGVFLSNTTPARFHIHTVMRTPNGNDYARDLVCQFRESRRENA